MAVNPGPSSDEVSPLKSGDFTAAARGIPGWGWAWRAAKPTLFFLAFFLVVLLLHHPHRRLPFWSDSLGYMITNSVHMREHHTWYQPLHHDTGHPPLTFGVLLAAWSLLGASVTVSHGVQWIWGALLLAGMWKLCWVATNRSWLLASLGAALTALHPHLYALTDTLLPEIPMAALFVWMVYGFYARRAGVYLLAATLLLLTKVNAYPLFAYFVGTELGLFPVIRWIQNRRHRDAVREMVRHWIRWLAPTGLALVPLALWFTIHWIHQGFPLQSEEFSISTRISLTPEKIHEGLLHEGLWAVWWTEGNRLAVGMGAVLLTVAVAVGAVRHRSLRFLRETKPPGLLRHPLALVGSLAIQSAPLYVLLSLKVMNLQRYYLTIHVVFIVFLVVAMAQAKANLLQGGAGRQKVEQAARRLAVGVALSLAGLLALGNYAVRLHPKYPDRLPFLSERIRAWFRNDNPTGYTMNLQMYDALYLVRKAVRWIEKESAAAEQPPVIVASYPYYPALIFPEAGYRKTRAWMDVRELATEQEFLERPWDYCLQAPLQLMAGDMPSERVLEKRKAMARKRITRPDAPWGFTLTIYQAGIGIPEPQRADAAGHKNAVDGMD